MHADMSINTHTSLVCAYNPFNCSKVASNYQNTSDYPANSQVVSYSLLSEGVFAVFLRYSLHVGQ